MIRSDKSSDEVNAKVVGGIQIGCANNCQVAWKGLEEITAATGTR